MNYNKTDKNIRRSSRLGRLFDRWIPESVTMMWALRFLQFLRLLGVKATGNGWRKVTSIFFKNKLISNALGIGITLITCVIIQIIGSWLIGLIALLLSKLPF